MRANNTIPVTVVYQSGGYIFRTYFNLVDGNPASSDLPDPVTPIIPTPGSSAQAKTVTPYTTSQVVRPDSGYDYLSRVTVEAISYTETENAAGGVTVIIGTEAP